MTDAIAWTVEQMGRVDDLPGALPAEKPNSRPAGTASEAIRKHLDRTWRSRPELARLAGVGQSTVGRAMAHLVATGEAEMLEARFPLAAQYRRAR